jgi:hypothetical protein
MARINDINGLQSGLNVCEIGADLCRSIASACDRDRHRSGCKPDPLVCGPQLSISAQNFYIKPACALKNRVLSG